MSGYVLSAHADLDLGDIWEFIAQDDIDAADGWIAKLFDAFEALGETPGYPVQFFPVGDDTSGGLLFLGQLIATIGDAGPQNL